MGIINQPGGRTRGARHWLPCCSRQPARPRPMSMGLEGWSPRTRVMWTLASSPSTAGCAWTSSWLDKCREPSPPVAVPRRANQQFILRYVGNGYYNIIASTADYAWTSPWPRQVPEPRRPVAVSHRGQPEVHPEAPRRRLLQHHRPAQRAVPGHRWGLDGCRGRPRPVAVSHRGQPALLHELSLAPGGRAARRVRAPPPPCTLAGCESPTRSGCGS